MLGAACGGGATGADPGPSTAPQTTAAPTTAATTLPAATTTPSGTDPVPTSPSTATTLPPLRQLRLEVVADGLDAPVLVTSPPGDPRLFVVEKPGRIRLVDAAAAHPAFLDITALVGEEGLEQGLLGLAFHPGYADNGRFFVHYTDTGGRSVVAGYRVSADPDRADPESIRVLLVEEQPRRNHNGGMIAFGPDGHLYVAFGDGGGAGDPFDHGQRPETRLGAILRLDVDGPDGSLVPPDNPFAAAGGAPEVWAYGLRNPWRFSFDGGLLYIADVGQSAWEEVNVVGAAAAGLNFGWPILEGEECFAAPGCSTDGLEMPVLVYSHAEGCSVTGGYVYRGAAIPELDGHYFYGDWCGGWIRSFRYRDGEAVDRADWSEDLGDVGRVVSFGIDSSGEVYVVVQEGLVFRLVPVR